MFKSVSVRLVLGLAYIALISWSAQAVEIGKVTPAMKDQSVSIEGKVTKFVASWKETAPNKLTVSDDNGSVIVVVWPDAFNALSVKPAEGSAVRVNGKVSVYRDELQIKISNAEGLRVLDGTTAPEKAPEPEEKDKTKEEKADKDKSLPQPAWATPIAQITGADKKQAKGVLARIVSVRPSWQPKAPNIITVEDESGRLDVVCWPDTYDQLPVKPEAKQIWMFRGEVDIFRDKPQLKVTDPKAMAPFKVKEPSEKDEKPEGNKPHDKDKVEIAPAPLPTGPIDVSQVTQDALQQTITVTGKAVGFRPSWSEKSPNLLTLEGAEGKTIDVVMWNDVFKALETKPQVGSAVTAKGKLIEHKGKLQLQINSADALKVQ